MLNYMLLYVVEIAMFGIICAISLIMFITKHRKGLLKLITINFFIFIVAFIVTFILEKPQMNISEVENVEAKSQISIDKPKTYYHFRDVTNKVNVVNDIDLNTIGEYNVKFEIETITGKYVKNTIVKVVDTLPPEITLVGEEEYKQSYLKEYEEPGYSAKDDFEGDLTEKIEVSKEEINDTEYNIKYSVQDSSGNKSEKKRHIIIIDDIPPTLTLNGKSNIILTLNQKYTENGAKAIDEKEGDLSEKIEIDGEVDTSKEGEYIITYKVSDSKGNEASAKRRVIVSETKVAENENETITAQDGSNGAKGVIYLTFDDGPSSSITPKILDILNEKGIKATFFILNYSGDGEKLVKREYAEGHTVGIHGYSHDYATIYQSVDTYMNNITKLQDKIKKSTGYNATITRFPGGSSNTISRKYCPGIMTKLCHEMLSREYTYFDWNVSSGDAGGAKTSDDVYNNVTNGISKSRANVVLMHDFSGNTKTLNALADIIDYGKENGYTFRAINESTPMVTHKPNN